MSAAPRPAQTGVGREEHRPGGFPHEQYTLRVPEVPGARFIHPGWVREAAGRAREAVTPTAQTNTGRRKPFCARNTTPAGFHTQTPFKRSFRGARCGLKREKWATTLYQAFAAKSSRRSGADAIAGTSQPTNSSNGDGISSSSPHHAAVRAPTPLLPRPNHLQLNPNLLQ